MISQVPQFQYKDLMIMQASYLEFGIQASELDSKLSESSLEHSHISCNFSIMVQQHHK